MSNPITKFCLQIQLRPKTHEDVLEMIRFLQQNHEGLNMPETTPIPTHLFFMSVPEWYLLFQDAKVTLERAKNRNWVLMAEGTTALEEQDIGLFLRWLAPWAVSACKKRPMRLAVARCSARPDYSSVSYFLREHRITMDYTTKPTLSVNQFRMAVNQ